jgi:hypothetical protein
VAHVDADLLDARSIGIVRINMIGKLTDGVRVAAA